jgi:hypothetical protein
MKDSESETLTTESRAWKRFRNSVKEDFRLKHRNIERKILALKAEIKTLKATSKTLQNSIEQVDDKCNYARESYDLLIQYGKVKLNSNSAEAIINRNLCHVIGLTSGLTTVLHDKVELLVIPQYWCDPWFLKVLSEVPDNGSFYKRLARLSTAQDQEEINEEIGLLLLATQ